MTYEHQRSVRSLVFLSFFLFRLTPWYPCMDAFE